MAIRVLFVSNDASRTGAPMVLLHLLTWLKKHTAIQFEIALIKGGPLEADFRALGKVYVYKQKKKKALQVRVLNKLKIIFFNQDRDEVFFSQFNSKKYDLVYGNTVVTAKALAQLKQQVGVKTILHMHELENVIKKYCGETFHESMKHIDKFIACSHLVAKNLTTNYNITNSHLIHAFVASQPTIETTKNELKKQLNIPEDGLVIGGSGTLGWRKGLDFYLSVAKQILDKNTNVYFVWVGGDVETQEYRQYLYDIENMGLTGRAIITGNQPNPQDYFNAFDVFLMTSKEDPFPLVCIENALLKKPIILFDKGVGSAEYIQNQVPYLDVDAMAVEVQKYIDSASLRERDGVALYEKAQEFTVEKSAQKVYDLILNTVKK